MMVDGNGSRADFEEEIENALSVDDQRIGDVYRAWRKDKNKHPRSIAGNLIFSVQQSRFRNWLDESPEDALQALQAIWAEDDFGVARRIREFGEFLPVSVSTGGGTRMNIISVLLMGLDAERYPPFRVTRFDEAYERTGYEPREGQADEAAMYDHALCFLDRFVDEAGRCGLTIPHRLDAQSLVRLVTGDYIDVPSEDPSRQTKPDLQRLADALLLKEDDLKEVRVLLDDKRQVIFQGPPGTGKTYIAQELAKCLAGPGDTRQLLLPACCFIQKCHQDFCGF